jgi:hypothetical protein
MRGIFDVCREERLVQRRTYTRPGDAYHDSPDRKQLTIERTTCDECDAAAPEWLEEHFRARLS